MVKRKAWGALFAVLLLFACEWVLHIDSFLYKYRSVFAAGRLMDKLDALTKLPIDILLLGNSRIDNGFDPGVLKEITGLTVFNLGVPGANAEILYGIASRLDKESVLGKNKIDKVLIGLDESIFQPGDSLGYGIFFADRKELMKNHQFKSFFHSYFRLLGYGSQLKELREPEKLFRFIKATFKEIEPIGGAAIKSYGYRPGVRGKFQNDEQLLAQESGADNPPDKTEEHYFWKLINLLRKREIDVVVFFPPLLNRDVLFLNYESDNAKPYLQIKDRLMQMGVNIIDIGSQVPRSVSEFANAGHLNKKGAIHYSEIMGLKIRSLWLNSNGN